MLGLFPASVPRAATILRAREDKIIQHQSRRSSAESGQKSNPGPRVPSSPRIGQVVPPRENGQGRSPVGEGLCPVSGLICRTGPGIWSYL